MALLEISLRQEKKRHLFEYLIYLLKQWKDEQYPNVTEEFTKLKLQKILFLVAAVKATAQSHPLLEVFNNFYALPNDFPGYEEASSIVEPYAHVNSLEQSFANAINDTRFIPYIQLHEFEALVFCGIDHLVKIYPKCKKSCKQLTTALQKSGNPELIDGGPTTAPSKRIEGEKKYKYNKPATGKSVTKEVGIDELRAKCQHFNDWIETLIDF